MEERIKENNAFMIRVNKFIDDSTSYRAKDEIVQKYQAEKLESVDTKVGIQNGRIFQLEKSQVIMDTKIQQRKDNYNTALAIITIIATIVMAISAFVTVWITFFKK